MNILTLGDPRHWSAAAHSDTLLSVFTTGGPRGTIQG